MKNKNQLQEKVVDFIKNADGRFLLVGDIGTWHGRYAGGCYIETFDDLYKFWRDCRDIKVWDEGGHLYIKASHHDGTNYAEMREITTRGEEYIERHYYDMDDSEIHEKLFNSNFYTRLPHYAHVVWGTKKGV